ncbi:hypothetical protein SAICODRAFT_27868 [Saitoella complicata NRRL Y-17804]|uniref:uncharacterized protein n=1 Tax=Saitoella complicata (strain BCRC 22490 / CBS 7301 / JCM 7358 / NBRC 10748 / NRRL Y-17804) TaxID=698492 RepID=UPI0008681849|nr:uncharacterized protein SAICODRAFT_27868 [Saitoella complicata NRRL Y-17804]ODQ50177.1 hypothetical protein SAICODRAFT_27868 [Saitoella complicata NRRL Y-17804]
MPNESTIKKLPNELVTEVALYLSAADLLSLGSTCRAMRAFVRDADLWTVKIKRDFGCEGLEFQWEQSDDGAYSSRERQRKYMKLEEGNGHYWRIEHNPRSPFGRSLNLGHRWVFWLHAHTRLRIPPGRYEVSFGLQVVQPNPMLRFVSFKIQEKPPVSETLDGEAQMYADEMIRFPMAEVQSTYLRALSTPDFREVTWQSTFLVRGSSEKGKEWGEVEVEIKDTSDMPKTGVNLDYVKFKRVHVDEDTIDPVAEGVNERPIIRDYPRRRRRGDRTPEEPGLKSLFTGFFSRIGHGLF